MPKAIPHNSFSDWLYLVTRTLYLPLLKRQPALGFQAVAKKAQHIPNARKWRSPRH
ncbi:hypothetical protein Cri9333_4712 (plasmid) [Crinalium epipsammum PCC 9333]|uniref:Uncharacterized protein n=1 Tax=Crinalium epipsammum PCC 9333 TaxID=1173022 RepID=K9W5L2_9CYAN|nr:hypothetical protein [Crinalium epipsammum]AFZ15491.1 hypothetical protein Cri9333_4712 [Crinalium epipsammum PCC 9333]